MKHYSVQERSNINLKEKNAIFQKVKEFVKNHDTLMMNAGTTPLFVMRAIWDKKETIVTNKKASDKYLESLELKGIEIVTA